MTTLILFFSAKKVCKKALKTASRSVATDYFHSVHSIAKNDKLPMVKQCHFLNATPFSTFNAADVLKREQEVTHLLMLKLRFNPYWNIQSVYILLEW